VASASGPPLMDGLGHYRHPVTTRSAQAQRWFDQGLVLGYAFNQQAAEQAFLRATELDPSCAMCWWGSAWVLGPTINSGMDPDDVPYALERIARAREAAVEGEVSDVERAFVEALATRYQRNPPVDRHALDEAYARAMRAMIDRFPEDLDARTLFADALMNLHPWNYYDAAGAQQPWTQEIVTVLEKVIAEEPEHPGANPLYVYVTEPSTHPERAVEHAQRLERIAPAAGHFLHLAAHVWYRLGRYPEATAVSLRAIAADATWAATSNPEPGLYVDGYMPHHFAALWASAMMHGASGRALAAASEVANRVDLDQSRQPGYEALQHAWAAPFFARVRFGRWDEILAEPAPPGDLPYPEAIWHFARGLALVRQQQPDDAKRELDALYAAAAHPSLRDASMWELNKLSDVLAIAQRLLASELAAQRGDTAGAVTLLREAAVLEDGLHYDEPPAWPLPVRQYLGALLLETGKAAEAQAVYEEDLKRYPENGWSLTGLKAALEAQDKGDEAKAVAERRKAAWKDADVTIKGSRA
ncbi:MAG TPA: hypothetical protein VJM11_12130, partial [Nevskiaceae bacterium]|nr:hypothetical protein [Nevskiaceae bacterium]